MAADPDELLSLLPMDQSPGPQLPLPFPFLLMANVTTALPAEPLDESHLWSVHSTSELVEMLYQMCFFAIGAPLNAVALKNFYKKRTKGHSGEMRLIRLSRQLLIAHLMVLCIYCLWRTHWIWNIYWTQGNGLCKMYSFLSALPFHLWSNMVAAIAIDMLYCIRVPLGSVPNGNRRVTWLIGLAWLLAILCALPMTVFRGTRPIPHTPFVQCYHLKGFSASQTMVFHFFHVVTTFYIPLAVILFCYVSIGLSLRHQGASLRQSNCLANTDQHKRLQQNTKLRFLKATAAIVCAFVLSWLPYQVMALLRVVCEPDSKCEQIASNFNWLQSILLASTCINPFLYRFGIFKSRGDCRKRTTTACLGNGSLAFGDSGGALPKGATLIRQMSRSDHCSSMNYQLSLRSNRSMVLNKRRNGDSFSPPSSPLSNASASGPILRKCHSGSERSNPKGTSIPNGIYQKLEEGQKGWAQPL
uniref:G-protein coupled receptors family 1 profile domain-containing protein n=1 Tax=Globodera rostochiensis TaxID=31243 RepID=A0A914I741_GLORO